MMRAAQAMLVASAVVAVQVLTALYVHILVAKSVFIAVDDKIKCVVGRRRITVKRPRVLQDLPATAKRLDVSRIVGDSSYSVFELRNKEGRMLDGNSKRRAS